MKKILLMFFAFTMVLYIAGCGAKEEENTPNNDNQNQTENNGNNESNNDSKEITVEDVMNAPVSPESDFDFVPSADGEAELAGYNGDSDIVVIPETWRGLKITKIQSYVFGVSSTVKAVKVPDSVTLVNEFAFGGNTNLEIVVFGSGVKEIGNSAFQGCTNLQDLILNEGLVKIGHAGVGGCTNLKYLNVPETVTDISHMAFYACPDDFVLAGKAGSTIEAYAKDKGITFEAN